MAEVDVEDTIGGARFKHYLLGLQALAHEVAFRFVRDITLVGDVSYDAGARFKQSLHLLEQMQETSTHLQFFIMPLDHHQMPSA